MSSTPTQQALEAELASRSAREIAILRAAYQVMARSGSSRLSLQDIADVAGVSKGLILYHFKSKSLVLQKAMQWAVLETARRIYRSFDLPGGSDRLGLLLDAIFVSPEANRDFQLVYLDLIEYSVREQTFADLPATNRQIMEGLYAEVLTRGVEAGIFDVDDIEEAAMTMRVIIDGTFVQWLQRPDWEVSHAGCKERCRRTLAKVLNAA